MFGKITSSKHLPADSIVRPVYQKLNKKLLIAVALPVGASLFGVLLVLLYFAGSNLHKIDVNKNLAFMVRLTDTVSEAIDFRNWALIERTLIQNLSVSDEVAYVYVFDASY